MSIRTALITAAAALAFAAPAHALLYTGQLLASNEVPPVASPGTGVVNVDFDIVAHTMAIDVTFANLVGTTTVAHIHCCAAPGSNAGVATTTPSFAFFPSGVSSGSYSRVFDTLALTTYSAAFVGANGGTAAGAEAALLAGLDAGLAYFNLHTNFAPGGEIRANLVAAQIPEPSTAALIALGLGAVALRRRRV